MVSGGACVYVLLAAAVLTSDTSALLIFGFSSDTTIRLGSLGWPPAVPPPPINVAAAATFLLACARRFFSAIEACTSRGWPLKAIPLRANAFNTEAASVNSTYPTPLLLFERWSRISRMSRTLPACEKNSKISKSSARGWMRWTSTVRSSRKASSRSRNNGSGDGERCRRRPRFSSLSSSREPPPPPRRSRSRSSSRRRCRSLSRSGSPPPPRSRRSRSRERDERRSRRSRSR